MRSSPCSGNAEPGKECKRLYRRFITRTLQEQKQGHNLLTNQTVLPIRQLASSAQAIEKKNDLKTAARFAFHHTAALNEYIKSSIPNPVTTDRNAFDWSLMPAWTKRFVTSRASPASTPFPRAMQGWWLPDQNSLWL